MLLSTLLHASIHLFLLEEYSPSTGHLLGLLAGSSLLPGANPIVHRFRLRRLRVHRSDAMLRPDDFGLGRSNHSRGLHEQKLSNNRIVSSVCVRAWFCHLGGRRLAAILIAFRNVVRRPGRALSQLQRDRLSTFHSRQIRIANSF